MEHGESEYTAIDLFAGCGGLSLGLKQSGFRVLGAIEMDSLCVEAYRLNHRGTEVWTDDIVNVTTRAVKAKLGLRRRQLDLLAGCPPCQGFSALRTMNGGRKIRDPKQKDLIFEFLRFVTDLLPRVIMLENVPGLADDRRFGRFKRALKKLGYICTVGVLDTADYKVPQRRNRLILLASRFGKLDFAVPVGKRVTVRNAIGHLPVPGTSGDPVHDMAEQRATRVAELIRLIPKDGGSRTDLGDQFQLACHRSFTGFKDVYGRMHWDDVAPTITSGCFNPSKGRFLHPDQDRGITMREASLLQSFPAQYRFPSHAGKIRIARMIGNALPPRFIKMHARVLRAHLDAVKR